MRLTPEHVVDALYILEGTRLTDAEAEAIAELLEWNQEFVASLFLRRDTFSSHPGVAQHLLEVATGCVVAASTARPTIGDIDGRASSMRQIATSLEELLSASAKSCEAGRSIVTMLAEAAYTKLAR